SPVQSSKALCCSRKGWAQGVVIHSTGVESVEGVSGHPETIWRSGVYTFYFTTGMAMSSTLMTTSVAITYANFYACLKCLYGLIVSLFAFLTAFVYVLEVVKDKILDRRKGTYLAALPGFFKCTDAFVSCIIFMPLTVYRDKSALILFVFIFLVISVVLYVFAAIVCDCPASYCIWAIQFIVAFMTYVNLILFSVDLIFHFAWYLWFQTHMSSSANFLMI
uniref:MARVEL domain-containing protein n=1 Tax=Cynoglossus semilaevis TaxID=244447 RepID=A0A3P8WTE4_CYNSE